jgi:hypothetical protein
MHVLLRWYETDDKAENLSFFFYVCAWHAYGNFGKTGPAKKWKINKISGTQLWIELRENNTDEWIHFKKI